MPARKIKPKKIRPAVAWSSLITLALLAGVTLWVSRSLRLVKVPSESMLPTLQPGDVLTMRIDAYRQGAPRRGDLIVFHDPNNGELLIKRVVGQPGEPVTAWSGRMWVNGQRLQESYVIGQMVLEAPITVVLKDDEVWVMGDNRDFSDDSRDYGPVKLKQIVGRAEAIIWPLKRRGPLQQ
jgi:signal peptidase I